MDDRTALRRSYDRVAGEYAARIGGELAAKPADRALLDDLVQRTRGRGRLADVGCGPGHVTAYLCERGADAFGLDLSAGMVAEALRRHPDVEFGVGDLDALDLPNGSLAGAVAFYSLIHHPAGRLGGPLAELRRVLAPGGVLLVAFHVGTEVRHLDQWWDRPVSVDFHFFEVAPTLDRFAAAGLVVDDATVREPYAGVEVATRRCYVRARRPEG